MSDRDTFGPELIEPRSNGSQRFTPPEMRNGMPESDAEALLGAQAIDGNAQIDDHPPRRVEGSRVSHLEQPVGERALGRNHARNLLRRIGRILEGLLHLDHDLRKGGQIPGPGPPRGRPTAQKIQRLAGLPSSHRPTPWPCPPLPSL